LEDLGIGGRLILKWMGPVASSLYTIIDLRIS